MPVRVGQVSGLLWLNLLSGTLAVFLGAFTSAYLRYRTGHVLGPMNGRDSMVAAAGNTSDILLYGFMVMPLLWVVFLPGTMTMLIALRYFRIRALVVWWMAAMIAHPLMVFLFGIAAKEYSDAAMPGHDWLDWAPYLGTGIVVALFALFSARRLHRDWSSVPLAVAPGIARRALFTMTLCLGVPLLLAPYAYFLQSLPKPAPGYISPNAS